MRIIGESKLELKEKLERFRKWNDTLSAYRMALILLSVDANDRAPMQGAEYRGKRRSILVEAYEKLRSDEEMFDIICSLYEDREHLDDDLARELELNVKMLRRERCVSPAEKAAYDQVLARSQRMWLKAKSEADFKNYIPYLEPVVEGYKSMIAKRDSSGRSEPVMPGDAGFEAGRPEGESTHKSSLYDQMLDDHQPGWNVARYDSFFADIRSHILPVLDAIKSAPPIRDDFLHQSFPVDKQRQVMKQITDYIGFTDEWGKVGESEHPLTSPICRGDVRFTTKYREFSPVQGVFSTVHESGHAWHAHGLDPRYEGTLIGTTASAGLCESQSRLCENHLGRSLAFLETILPFFQKAFPARFEGIDARTLYRAANIVRVSPIRTEADEVTYPLHIMIRYELEKEMMDGNLPVRDLEEAWNAKYQQYLGITPANAAEGVLQDMHWPYAYFGYFPTYALGSAVAAQFFATMQQDLDVPHLLRTGHYTDLMTWLGQKVHRYGNRYSMEEIIKKATGEDFTTSYYTTWLEEKYLKSGDLYNPM